jgi:hypothetical protein
LEIVYRVTPIGGSNPSLSAKSRHATYVFPNPARPGREQR